MSDPIFVDTNVLQGSGCRQLLGEDLQNDPLLESLVVTNPFSHLPPGTSS